MVLALKLAELEILSTKLSASPILLLDDVSSELDPERNQRLFDAIAEHGRQVWVSTTGAVALPVPANSQWIDVQEGRLQL